MIAMLKFTVAMLVLVGCGGATDDGSPPCVDASSPLTPQVDASVVDAVALNPDCLETDVSITTCAKAQAPASWSAPLSCVKDFVPGFPQKRLADGTVTQRPGRACCGFFSADGVTALCCADLATCLGP